MTSGIECRGCGGDCRYCNCEYQQTVSADLQKEADKALKKLRKAGVNFTLYKRADSTYSMSNIDVSLKDILDYIDKLKQKKRNKDTEYDDYRWMNHD